MCCFSGSVTQVANTSIFARMGSGDTQFLAYHMTYSADQAVAMILPLPVKTPAIQNSVRFINLERYPDLFLDLASGFPVSRGRGPVAGGAGGAFAPQGVLSVERVGNFVASFVPTQNDFARLDKQFLIPPATWDKIPAYHDYGFAVFQLKPLQAGRTAHPIALEFTTRLRECLFFPTVHIHNGQVLTREQFDHNLYYQAPPPTLPSIRRAEVTSQGFAERFVKAASAGGLVVGSMPCRRLTLQGYLPNTDTFVPAA